MKRSSIVLGILLLVGALFPAVALAAPAKSQHPSVSSSHVHLMLTKQGYTQANKQYKGPHNSLVQGNGDLFWHGGAVQPHPVAYLVFWGSSWDAGGGTLTPDAQVVVNFFTNVGHSEYFNIMSQYFGSNASAIANAETLGGVYLDETHTIPTDTSCAGTTTVEDTSVRAEVGNAIATKGWPVDPTNALYLVFTPNGYYENQSSATSPVCSEQIFCAYHGDTFFSSNTLAYAAMPYPINTNACPDLDGISPPNGNVAGDALANFASHESAETMTDPLVGTGWYDNAGFEIGDKCAYNEANGDTTVNGGRKFALQTEYTNAGHQCVNSYTPDTAGIYRPSTSTFYLRNSNSAGGPDLAVSYGGSGDIPLVGDWTGKGYDSIGVYRPSTSFFYLRNTNTPGGPDITIDFGAPGDIPVVGDFCGNGADGIGVFRPSNGVWYVRCTATPGGPDAIFAFGANGDVPLVGDWSNNGFDGIGVYRPSTQVWYLSNFACSCSPAYAFAYGAAGDKPITGDYSSQGDAFFTGPLSALTAVGIDTPGVFRPSNASFYLSNQQGPVPPSYLFPYGSSTDVPLMGQWVSQGPGIPIEQ